MSAPRSPERRRLRAGPLLAVALALVVLGAVWWWAFAGEGRQRFRAAEPTPADAGSIPQ